MTSELITGIISSITDQDLGKTLAELNAVHDVQVNGSEVKVYLILTQPIHSVARSINAACTRAITEAFPQAEVEILVQEAGLPQDKRSASIGGVKNLIAVASGKGGVGKSTVAANLAVALAQSGATTGLIDADIYGPSQPTMYGLSGEGMRAEKTDDGKIIGFPNERFGVKVASIGFVMQRDQAAILRGPMLAGYFNTLVDQIQWGDLDFLIFDLPPGTGDIQLTLTQRIPLTGAVIVTTPQEIALADVRRSIQMFRKVNVDVLGVVENMSYFIPPDMPEKKYHIFGEGGGRSVAKEYGVELLGELPLDTRIREGADSGFPIVLDTDAVASGQAFRDLAQSVMRQVRLHNSKQSLPYIDITL